MLMIKIENRKDNSTSNYQYVSSHFDITEIEPNLPQLKFTVNVLNEPSISYHLYTDIRWTNIERIQHVIEEQINTALQRGIPFKISEESNRNYIYTSVDFNNSEEFDFNQFTGRRI